MKLQKYKTGSGNICITSCLRDMLNYFGFEVREYMIFVVSMANMFYYEDFFPEKNKTLKMGGIYYDVLTVIENALEFFNLKPIHINSDDAKEILDFVRNSLSNDCPVMAITSRKYLDYMPANFKDNIPHCINIIGLEEDGFIVSDTYIPTKPVDTYEGYLSEKSFLRSIQKAEGIYRGKFRYGCLTIKPESRDRREVKTFSEYPMEKMLWPILAAADTYLDGEVSEDRVLVGAKGLRKFQKDFVCWFQTQDEKNMKQLLKNIHNHLVDFGGCVTTYHFMSEFFTFLAQKTEEPFWYALSDDMQFLSRRWYILANTICKAAFIVQGDTEENIRVRLDELLSLEWVLWNKVKLVCEGLLNENNG